MSGGDPGTGSGGMPAAPAPSPADVGIVAALSMEVGFLLDRLTRVRKYAGPRHAVVEGECGGKVVAVVVAGMGRENIRRGARIAARRPPSPLGRLGRVRRGAEPRVFPTRHRAGRRDPRPRRPPPPHRRDGPPEERGSPIRTGRLLTVDHIIRTAAEKAELRRRYDADLVDMETAAVAALCSERGVRFLSIRVISDEAGIDLPPEIVSLMTRSGSYRVGAALRAIWNRPSSIKDLLGPPRARPGGRRPPRRLHSRGHRAAGMRTILLATRGLWRSLAPGRGPVTRALPDIIVSARRRALRFRR